VNAASIPSFINPSFETPVIANDSSMNITSAISGGWNVTGTVSILNNYAVFAASTNNPLFRSYANGNQCVALIGVSSISQSVYITPGYYQLLFAYSGMFDATRRFTDNIINITMNGTAIYTQTTSIFNWTPFSIPFQILTAGAYTFAFNGTGTTTYTPSASYVPKIGAIDNIRIIPKAMLEESFLYMYRNAATTSINLTYFYNSSALVDTKLLDYSANAIYNAFINVSDYGIVKSGFKAYVYDVSHNQVGNTVSWSDASFGTIFTEMYVGRPRDLSNSTVFKGRIHNVNMIMPNDSYYGFLPTGGDDYVATSDYYTTNASGANTT
jgi:hypothetical protein